MRILVDGAALERSTRMRVAAAGLALRGHAVTWSGPEPPGDVPAPDLERTPGGLAGVAAIARRHADVVIGGDARMLRTALLGSLARSYAMIVAFDPLRFARVPLWERWAWEVHYAMGLVEPEQAGEAHARFNEPVLQRLALWPDAELPAAPDPGHVDVEVLERACERAIARHRGPAARAAIFLDRDGTLVIEREYLADPDGLTLLPGVPAALQSLRAAGFPLIVISNQSGIGRGLYTLERAHAVMARLRVLLRAHGVELDGIYLCPHRPEEGCPCRKPATGLLERAADDHGIALERSAMVGDKRIDVETGHRVGASGLLVRTGYGSGEIARWPGGTAPPDCVAADLGEAATWILRHLERVPA